MPWLNLAQGSEEWLQERRGRITGSRFKDARDCSDGLTDQQRKYVNAIKIHGLTEEKAREAAGYKAAPKSDAVSDAIKKGFKKVWGGKAIAYAMDLARERLGGNAPSKFTNAAMRQGTEQEPYARAAYEGQTGEMVEEVGFFVSEDGVFGLSPDGIINDDGVQEIKTMVSSDTLFRAVADGDISEYIDQCNGYLWLLGRQYVDLCLWVPDLQILKIIRIERDEEAIQALEDDMMAFAKLVNEYEARLKAALH